MYDPVHDIYHLFYQYQTPRMWGHAISRDLVDWEQLPMALTRQRSYDEFGDFSGSATILDDTARTPVRYRRMTCKCNYTIEVCNKCSTVCSMPLEYSNLN